MVVIRCPACGERSRVGPGAVGQLVLCPRCEGPFVAAAEADARPEPPPEPAASPRHARPVRPPAPPPAEPVPPPEPPAVLAPSVLVGLALLPFVVPLVWLVGPALAGRPSLLSMAAPIALAVTAATLSLAVVYTIDWTPETRVKGVLAIVGLAYFAGLSLYFVRKDSVAWAARQFGPDVEWQEVRPPGGKCSVRTPGGRMDKADDQPLRGWPLKCYRTPPDPDGGPSYTIAWRPDLPRVFAPRLDDDDWFAAVKKSLAAAPGVRAVEDETAVEDGQNTPGRQWVVRTADGATVRVVRVYRTENRLYYLAAEGPDLAADDRDAQHFLRSFSLGPARE